MVAAAVAYASEIYRIMPFDKLGGFGFSGFAPDTGSGYYSLPFGIERAVCSQVSTLNACNTLQSHNNNNSFR